MQRKDVKEKSPWKTSVACSPQAPASSRPLHSESRWNRATRRVRSGRRRV